MSSWAARTDCVLSEVLLERRRQDKRWGQQNHPNGTGGSLVWLDAQRAKRKYEAAAKEGKITWRLVLEEEVAEAFAESNPARLREELLQVAAVAVAWVESLDRDSGEDGMGL